MDLVQFKTETSYLKTLKNLELGLVFFMDYNEDRQLVIENDGNVDIMESWVESVDRSNDHTKCSIYLDTIGDR